MKKKYRKPAVLKREQNRVHGTNGSCGHYSTPYCGKLVVGIS